MKLVLISARLTESAAGALAKLVGKPPEQTRIALIENAADSYPASDRGFVTTEREAIIDHGFQIKLADIKREPAQNRHLGAELEQSDVIWLGGGNPFYLRWLIRHTETDEIIIRLAQQGKVVGGGSAGAVVIGPTLRYLDEVEDTSAAADLIWDGLALTDTVPVPHIDNVKYGPLLSEVNKKLKAAGFKTQPLRDDQSLIINGYEHTVV
jgi:dipeptidase E